MAAEDQGIMSLPMEGEAASQNMPQMPLGESYDAVRQGLNNASPQAAADVQQLMQSIMPQLDQLSDEQLEAFLQAVQYLYEGGEEQYAKRLQEAIDSGMLDQGDLPEDYDPELLSAIGTVLLQAIQQRQGGAQMQAMEPPVQQFARGGIAEAARMVASKGRNGDTMLAHITPEEARLLKKRGGSGTINPETGLPEFFLKKIFSAVKNVVKSVVNTVKKVLKSPVGKVLATVALATFLGPGAFGIQGLGLQTAIGTAGTLGLASGAVTLASGGSLKQALMAGATAYFGAPGGVVSQYVGGAVTNAAANAAITAGIVGTGAGLLTGQKLSNAVKQGLTAGATSGLMTGITQGFGSQIQPPETNLAPVEDRVGKPVTAGEVAQQVSEGAPGAASRSMAAQAGEFGPMNSPMTPQQIEANVAAPAAATSGSRSMAPSVTPPSAGMGRPPGAMESLTKVGGGISDLLQGKEGAFDTIKQGASDLFMPKTYTAAELQSSPVFEQARGAGASYSEALKRAGEAYNPSLIRQYAPMTVAGLGVAGLMGGFTPSKTPPSELAQQLRGTPGLDLINKDPSQYLVQNLPGVQYNEQGAIIGSTPWSPSATMADVQVAPANYAGGISDLSPAPGGPTYTPSPGSMGRGRSIAQPGNTASMYTNLMPQDYFRAASYDPYGYLRAADGGLASLAQGGYPRKTGAISGPGTETSDSIPAMLSDGEFVMTAKAVKAMGNGSRRAGAKKMYALMHQLERNASRG